MLNQSSYSVRHRGSEAAFWFRKKVVERRCTRRVARKLPKPQGHSVMKNRISTEGVDARAAQCREPKGEPSPRGCRMSGMAMDWEGGGWEGREREREEGNKTQPSL